MEFAHSEKELAYHCLAMKKLVIVKPGCREFGNELLNHMSIYAYGLEAGAQVVNRSAYGHSGLQRGLHALYARYIGYRYGACALRAWRAPIFLPPTKPLPIANSCDTIYFFGWVFRNPLGLQKYRKQLLKTFTPEPLQEKIKQIIAPWKGRLLIGIHVRKEDFKGFREGEFLVSLERVQEIVNEYVQEKNISPKNVLLVITSDLEVPAGAFDGFSTYMSYGNTQMNLFLLSKCSVVLGTNTTFSNLAAWFGNIPHIVTTNEPIDWTYYRTHEEYFENKYVTFAY